MAARPSRAGTRAQPRRHLGPLRTDGRGGLLQRASIITGFAWLKPTSTLRAVAFELKAFFVVARKAPVEVPAAEVFDFLAHQRRNQALVRLAGRPRVGPVGADDRPTQAGSRYVAERRSSATVHRPQSHRIAATPVPWRVLVGAEHCV
jgi:hypothetical protein